MNEVKRKALLNKIDEDWLALATELVFNEVPAENARKRTMLDQLLTLKDGDAYLLLFPLHQGILSLLIDQCDDRIGAGKISEIEMARLRRSLISDLQEVTDEDYMFHIPNDALSSSAAFAEILVDENILPELILEWSEETQEVLSYITLSMEIWNLINYYGAIHMDDLIQVQSRIYEEDETLPEGVLAGALVYIQLNLSEDTYFEIVDGENWFMTEYGDIDPYEVIEDLKAKGDLDYWIPDREDLMNMIHGITPLELLKVFDWLMNTFRLDEEGEEMLGDVNFLHGILMDLRSRHAEELPEILHELLGWEWEVTDEEARELLYHDFLHHMQRFHLKGHSQAQLDGDEDEGNPFFHFDEDEEEEDELFFEDEMPEEYNFKLRTKKDDDENYLN